MKSKPKQEEKRPIGRPTHPLTAVKFEAEVAALKRLRVEGFLTPAQYNDKIVDLTTRFREGRP